MLLLTLIQFLPFSSNDMSQYISIVLPASVMEMINPLIDEIFTASGGLISITAIAAIWSASKGVYALVCGLNQVYRVKETRNMIVVRAMSVFYTIVFIILIAACMMLLIFGKLIFEWIETLVPWLTYLTNFRYIIGCWPLFCSF